MQHCDAFDYWGSGTEVTVSSETAVSPTLFPLVKCGPEANGKITIGCLARDFYPKSLTFQWTDASGTTLSSVQHPPAENNNKYTGVSLLQVSKTDWNSGSFNCSVTHPGGTNSVELKKKVSSPPTLAAPITMTLKPPSPKEIFINNQAKLECEITGQDQITLNKIEITWEINGQTVTDNISPTTESGGRISTLTRSRSEWQSVNHVRCSAASDNMITVFQNLTVHKGDGRDPKVTVHILPEEDIKDSAEVTMVCLVSSPVLQDYYIAWLEQNDNIYTDGINFPPQKTKQGFLVTSIYSTSKDKWNKHNIFSCNVWPAGSERPMKTRDVSKAHDNSTESLNLHLAMSCTDDAIEEDEYSSLWSTTSSFIFLFISSLLYNMIFSLVKMKRP